MFLSASFVRLKLGERNLEHHRSRRLVNLTVRLKHVESPLLLCLPCDDACFDSCVVGIEHQPFVLDEMTDARRHDFKRWTIHKIEPVTIAPCNDVVVGFACQLLQILSRTFEVLRLDKRGTPSPRARAMIHKCPSDTVVLWTGTTEHCRDLLERCVAHPFLQCQSTTERSRVVKLLALENLFQCVGSEVIMLEAVLL